jgi:predicted porin
LLPDSGGGSGWTRRSTLGLITPAGELRAGRDYVPDFWAHTLFDPFGTNGVGSGINLIGAFNGASTFLRANNSLSYFLPALGGLYGQVQVAAGEGAVGNKHAGWRVGYEAGPLNVAVAAGQTDVDETRRWSRWNVGGSYSLGTVTLSGLFADTRAKGGSGDGQRIRFYLGGLQVPLQNGSVKLAYSRCEGGGVASTATLNASQVSAGYQHDLSQRTALYGNLAVLKNEGTATQVASASGPAGIRPGETSRGLEVGLRHVF